MSVPELALARLERDVENVVQRLRMVEDLSTPGIAQHLADYRQLRDKVIDMDVRGTAVTQERLKRVEDRIDDLRSDIQEIRDDQKATRNIVRSALITAALSIGVNIIVGVILFVVVKA